MKPKWEFERSISKKTHDSLLYRDANLGVRVEIHTPFRAGHPGKDEVLFFMDGDEREFKTEQKLMQALHAEGKPLCDCGMGDASMPELHARDCAINQAGRSGSGATKRGALNGCSKGY